MSDEISLRVNGKNYQGWETAQVSFTMKAVCASFSLSFTDRGFGLEKPWPIVPGDECTFFIGKDEVLSGFVDDFDPSADKSSRTLSVSGRNKVMDLVDCDVPRAQVYSNISLERYAQLLAAPFALKVRREADVGSPFFDLRAAPGENAFQAIEKAARQRGVLVLSDGRDTVLLTKAGAGKSSTRLVQGQNLEQISAKFSHKDRFSEYTVKSQMGGLENTDPAVAFQVTATAKDAGVTRFRPKTILAETAVDSAGARRRANWERNTRAGKAAVVSGAVQGYRQGDGRLWRINELVHVTSSWVGVDRELLVTGVKMTKNEQGSLTLLELELPQAYDALVELPKNDLLADLVRRNSR